MKKDRIDGWVDIHDENLMINLGIRPKDLEPRDQSVWTKTAQEKKILKKIRGRKYPGFDKTPIPEKIIPLRDKLIIQVKIPNDLEKNLSKGQLPKTTYSTICWQHEVPYVLNNYRPFIIKYKFNDIWYNSNEELRKY